MAQSVFNRYEKKYLMTEEVYGLLRGRLANRLKVDDYGEHTICNVYYDTENDMLIRRSIAKPKYKEKLRIRSYGIPEQNGKVFLEIKKKYRRIVNKRRIALPLDEAIDFAEKGIAPRHLIIDKKELAKDAQKVAFETQQITKEIQSFVNRYQLARATFLAYDRIALFDPEDKDFRVTFDKNIRSRDTFVSPAYGDFGKLLLPQGFHLMETKVMGATPKWFADILTELAIYPVSFSKYGNVYRKERLNVNCAQQMTHRLENWDNLLTALIEEKEEKAAC